MEEVNNYILITTSQTTQTNVGSNQPIASKPEVNHKRFLCTHYRRGLCTLFTEQCKYAHGVQDLVFPNLDPDNFQKVEETDATPEEKEILKQELMLINPDKLPIIYYQYQFELLKRGEIDTVYTLEEINFDSKVQKPIKEKFRKDLTQSILDHAFKLYNRNFLKKAFVQTLFSSMHWFAKWDYILDGSYASKQKHPKYGEVIVKLPQAKEFDELIQNAVISIVKDNNLLESIPISPAVVSTLYYKNVMPKDIILQCLPTYLKKLNLRFDEYLKTLTAQETFVKRLAEACGRDPQELLLIQPIFDERSNEYNAFMAKIENALLELIKSSPFGFALYTRYETYILETYAKEISQFNKNIPQMKRIMKEIAFKHNCLVIDLLSETYIFSPKKFHETPIKEQEADYHEKDSKCFQNIPLPFKIHEHPIYSQIDPNLIIHCQERMSEKELEEQINSDKIVVIDNETALEFARDYMADAKDIAVDLEGSLRKGGLLELVQIACGEYIFIFDFYGINLKANKSPENSPERVLCEEMIKYLKEIMENTNICKTFHDGRKDSVALHVFTHACPHNVFDTSAIYMLIEDLKKYLKFKDHFTFEEEAKKEEKKEPKPINDLTVIKIMTELERVGPPGLNEVLGAYDASHGLNGLKEIMRARFWALPRAYFLQRPIDSEFLVYSAKDVEDLVEVKEKMIDELHKVLKRFLPNIEREKVELLTKKVSRTYSIYGCTHSE